MSWDLAVDAAGPLGTPAEVRQKIDAVVRGVEWTDETEGSVEQDGYSLEFYLTDFDADDESDEEADGPDPNAPVQSLLISVRGSGDPLPVLVKLCKDNGWSLTDTGNDEAIDLDNPSSEGWREFQGFRDRAAKSIAAESKPGFFSRLFGRKGRE